MGFSLYFVWLCIKSYQACIVIFFGLQVKTKANLCNLNRPFAYIKITLSHLPRPQVLGFEPVRLAHIVPTSLRQAQGRPYGRVNSARNLSRWNGRFLSRGVYPEQREGLTSTGSVQALRNDKESNSYTYARCLLDNP